MSNMWVLPRGMKRDGRGGKNTISWVSKYGSLIVTAYDIGTAEGMNEKGLVVNELALVESNYGKPPDGSAVFEYVDGKLVIHHGKQYKVVTNSPTYDKQLAIMEYWKEAGGLEKSLPGTSRAADRFVRATYLLAALPTETSAKYISGSPQQKFQFQAAMSVLSLMRSVGTPLGFSLEEQPWVCSTIWRTVSDSTNRVVLFDSGNFLGAPGRAGSTGGRAGEEAATGGRQDL